MDTSTLSPDPDTVIPVYLDLLRTTRKPETIKEYGRDLSRFKGWLDKKGINLFAVTTENIAQYILDLQTERPDIKPFTIGRYMQSISAFFKYLVRAQIMSQNPMAILQKPRPRRPVDGSRLLTLQELLAMLAIPDSPTLASSRDTLIVHLLAMTKMELNMIVSLRLSDIDLIVRQGSVLGNGERIPFDESLVRAMREYINLILPKDCSETDDRYLFPSPKYGSRHICRRTIWKAVVSIAKRAGIRRRILANDLDASYSYYTMLSREWRV